MLSSFVTTLGSFTTLLQLSIGLNIACIAVYRVSDFGKIFEENISQTKRKIENRKNPIGERLIIKRKTLDEFKGFLDNSSVKEFYDKLESKYKNIEIDIADNHVNEILYNDIENKCMPRCMSGLCTLYTIYALISLFLITLSGMYMWIPTAYCLTTILFTIPFIIFVGVKFYLIQVLDPNIEKLKKPPFEKLKNKLKKLSENRSTINKIKSYFIIRSYKRKEKIRAEEARALGIDKDEIRLNDRNKLKQKRNSIVSIIGVRLASYVAIVLILIVIITLYFYRNQLLIFEQSLSKNIHVLIGCCSILLSYIAFLFYLIINIIYVKRANRIINGFFTRTEKMLNEASEIENTLLGYSEIHKQPKRQTLTQKKEVIETEISNKKETD